MKYALSAFALCALLVGCGNKTVKSEESTIAPIHIPEVKAILENPDLKMVNFAFNEILLTKTSKEILKKDATALMADANLKFQIQGFCDDRGSDAYNLALGERRAKVVKDYLKKLGISESRISVVSFGKSNPIDTHENETAYSLNRRASFYIGEATKNASL